MFLRVSQFSLLWTQEAHSVATVFGEEQPVLYDLYILIQPYKALQNNPENSQKSRR